MKGGHLWDTYLEVDQLLLCDSSVPWRSGDGGRVAHSEGSRPREVRLRPRLHAPVRVAPGWSQCPAGFSQHPVLSPNALPHLPSGWKAGRGWWD